jgi:hypothetical protein
MTLQNTTNATSSRASAAGHWPCGGPGLKACPESGQAPVPVSRFRALAKDRDTPTSGTCGPLFTASSPSAVLQRSLENRLRARMDANGSPEFALTWKIWDMPAGEPICALRASGRRTGGKGCIGWPTPQANKNTKNSRDPKRMKENGSQTCLADAAHLCPWSTPSVQDNANNAGPSQFDRNTHPLNVQATLAPWPTPQEDNANNSAGHKGSAFSDLPTVAGWATPRAEDAESAGMRHSRGVADTLTAQAGQDAARSSAATAISAAYRLNPRFSLWLMGYPDAWASCGERAMQSFRSARRSS